MRVDTKTLIKFKKVAEEQESHLSHQQNLQ
jgi:hypothetical protein